MSDPIKTGQPVPLWYEVTAVFSDDPEPITEPWNGEDFANRAAKAWQACAEADRADGKDVTVTVTVTPKYTPRKD